jgi:hypothetical protein
MVYNKSWNGSARSYLSNPCDYRNGTGAKSCLSSLSFLCGNLKMLIIKIMADIQKKSAFYRFLRCRRCVKPRLNIVKGKCKWLSVMARNLLILRAQKENYRKNPSHKCSDASKGFLRWLPKCNLCNTSWYWSPMKINGITHVISLNCDTLVIVAYHSLSDIF